MALPFLNGSRRRRDQVIAVDLGGRTTKAVEIRRKGDRLELQNFVVADAPIFEKTLSTEALSEHLKTVAQTLGGKTKVMTLAVSVGDAVVRHADMPQMPVGDMRQVLKANPKNFLQQDLPGHVFDCHVFPPRAEKTPADKAKAPSGPPKYRVLVAGARKQTLDHFQAAVRASGFTPEQILPGVVGPANAFEMALPEVFAKQVVALVDVGFRNTSISILREGELALSRVVAIGGDRLTNGLAESLGISYAEAEGIKIGMPTEVQSNLEALVLPLGRELRASIDFFEHQHEQTVSEVYLSGASARSEFLVAALQAELMVECKLWDPLASMQQSLSPEKVSELEQVAPQLAVAVGAALATL